MRGNSSRIRVLPSRSGFPGELVPPVNTASMEVLTMRPLPKLVQDPEPVVLLAALSTNPVEAAQAAVLPALAAPRVAGERPWREIPAVRKCRRRGGDRSRGIGRRRLPIFRAARALDGCSTITTQPAGARVFIGDEPEPVCQTPCDLQGCPTRQGYHECASSLPGYQEGTKEVRVPAHRREAALCAATTRFEAIS